MNSEAESSHTTAGPAVQALIHSYLADGLSLAACARRHGHSSKKIRRILEEAGIEIRTRRRAPCGHRAGANRHRRHGEKPCEQCREAANTYARGPNGAGGRARSRALTRLGWKFPSDLARLKSAANAQVAEEEGIEQLPPGKLRARAHQRALGELAQLHPDDYSALHLIQLQAENAAEPTDSDAEGGGKALLSARRTAEVAATGPTIIARAS